MERIIPTGQEILAQLNQLTEEYALSGDKSTIGGDRERTNASDSRQESLSSEDVAQSSETVDDNNFATSLRPHTPPRPAPPTPVNHPAAPALEPPRVPSALMPPAAGPPISVAEEPVSSHLRTRPEKSQKWKDSMRIGPQQEKGQPTKRKAPKETQEPAKRAKTAVENTTTTTTKRVAARSAGATSRKNKHQDLKSSRLLFFSTTTEEF